MHQKTIGNLNISNDDFCSICIEELEVQCQELHPDWFTPKLKERKSKFNKNIKNFIIENRQKMKCLVIMCDYYYSENFCSKHLIEIAQLIS